MAAVPSIVCPSCKKSFKGRAELIGKRILCPGCKHPFVVPAAKAPAVPVSAGKKADAAAPSAPPPLSFKEEEEDNVKYTLGDVDESHRCPNCANAMESEDAIVCLHCGYNTQTRTWGQTKKVVERKWMDWFWWHFPAYSALSVIIGKVTGALYYCLVMPYTVQEDSWTAFFVDHESTRLWVVIFGLFTIWAEGWMVYWRLIIHPAPPEKTK
jgi:DNA-directed RNA polymerase subunit RPC12/RpoP